MGHQEWYFFSEPHYFTTCDVDSLAETERLPFWFFSDSQRFEVEDTLAMAVNLMQAVGKGAVGSMGPTGHTFAVEYFNFLTNLFGEMVGSPETPIGTTLLGVKQSLPARTYRIVALLADPALVLRSSAVTGIVEDSPTIPSEARLYQNYPNPFNPSTTIRFSLLRSGDVSLKVFNVLGEEVAVVLSGHQEVGTHTVRWDGAGYPSGLYFYRLRVGDFVETKKLVLIK